ncbi:hypothetical protein CI1B_72640 [Bradyrhizobium ivorense]|uniref:Uncharacterized protein n=1 Tax=Bradyrhizobium ivorense TaxID=2511166 RepID=A0A508TV91_9BRAD|nr:hypothetical protein CI1B_72640 [Bradyrhizobium ivorense]
MNPHANASIRTGTADAVPAKLCFHLWLNWMLHLRVPGDCKI